MLKIITIGGLLLCGIQAAQAVENIRLRNAGGKCLTIKGGSLIKTTKPVHLWNCNRSESQNWYFDKKNRLVNVRGKCLNGKGKKVLAKKCNNSQTQQWVFDYRNRLVNKSSKRCLSVYKKEVFKKGGKIKTSKCSVHSSQQWFKDFLLGSNNSPRYGFTIKTKAVSPSQIIPITPMTLLSPPMMYAGTEPQPFTGIVAAHNFWRQKKNQTTLACSVKLSKRAKNELISLKKNAEDYMFCQLNPSDIAYKGNIAIGFRQDATDVVAHWNLDQKIANLRITNAQYSHIGCVHTQCGYDSSAWLCLYQ